MMGLMPIQPLPLAAAEAPVTSEILRSCWPMKKSPLKVTVMPFCAVVFSCESHEPNQMKLCTWACGLKFSQALKTFWEHMQELVQMTRSNNSAALACHHLIHVWLCACQTVKPVCLHVYMKPKPTHYFALVPEFFRSAVFNFCDIKN